MPKVGFVFYILSLYMIKEHILSAFSSGRSSLTTNTDQ